MVIFDANNYKDHFTNLCTNLLQLQQLHTTDTWFDRTRDRSSKNDLIFYRNIEIEFIEQIPVMQTLEL